MKSSSKLAIALACAFFVAHWNSPVLAQDLMTQGKIFYAKGNYKDARRIFEHLTLQSPNFWQAHYQLAHCDVKLEDFNRAEQEYKKCMALSTDPGLLKACDDAIKNIREHRKKVVVKQQVARHEDAVDNKRRELALKLVVQSSDEFNRRRLALLEKKTKIYEDGKVAAAAARQRAEKEIQYLHENGQWICRNSVTGELSVTVPSSVADEIRERGEAEARRIMEDADNRMKGIVIPEYDNTAHHMMQLTDNSKHGSKMHHVGTNLFVRSYTHNPKKDSTGKLIADTPESETK